MEEWIYKEKKIFSNFDEEQNEQTFIFVVSIP